jgi:hypothetical protein
MVFESRRVVIHRGARSRSLICHHLLAVKRRCSAAWDVLWARDLWLKPQAIKTPLLRSESQTHVELCSIAVAHVAGHIDLSAALQLAAEQPCFDSLGLQPEVSGVTHSKSSGGAT